MRESDLLAHIHRQSSDILARFPHVIAGPGHDCAVVALPGGECMLLKVDQVIEGLHFLPLPATPIELIARKAIARAISDIAAAGGRPIATLVGGILPHHCPWAAELSDQLSAWAAHWNAPLVGGDTSIWRAPSTTNRATDRAPEIGSAISVHHAPAPPPSPLILSITIVGTPHPTRGPVLRSGARPGDHLYVTGTLGGSFEKATGRGRHLTFEPRLREAAFLCETLGDDLHAMMDISDGLGRDAARLAAASGVRIEIDAAALPLSTGSTIENALADGEDYELLFTAPATTPVPAACPETQTPITRIGTLSRGSGCFARGSGIQVDCAGLGFEHGS
jgi:thiamine-monophosphate kinase